MDKKLAKRVYLIVKKIPKGEVLTYREVAQKINHLKAWRLVGNILSYNVDPKVPCHRVIRSDGKIGGYKNGTKNKIALLRKEGIKIKKGRIAL